MLLQPTGFSICGTQNNSFENQVNSFNVVSQIKFDYVDQKKQVKEFFKIFLCSTKEIIASRFGAIRG